MLSAIPVRPGSQFRSEEMDRRHGESGTGWSTEALQEALRELRGGPGHHDDSKIPYEGERIVLGPAWRQGCRERAG
jgi:hypothetical protein